MRSMKERISSLFYIHGLFCASHPFAIIAFVVCIILFTCYPLTKIPLPGNAPLEHSSPVQGYQPPADKASTISSGASAGSAEDFLRPRWYYGPPVAYIHQVVVKAAVSPWQQQPLIPTDAFRAPMSQVFNVLEQINHFNFKSPSGSKSLSDYCLRVSEPLHKQKLSSLMPQYNCLIVSPANMWGQDQQRFADDGHIMKTVHRKFGQPLDASPSVTDILFGLGWKDTGVPRFSQFYFRNRQRVISYAITIVLKEYNPGFMDALKKHLEEKYPIRTIQNDTEEREMVHVYFRDINYFVEYTPLILAYIVLFLYLYFSVRKIEMVKSKSGLAFSAVFTVMASLVMSIGIVTFFGMSPSLNGSEIFPYLVVIIGLENVLVVTRSVVNTPVHLEVKYRVAQGLSKEGWSIFKNLMTELFILTIGFLSMVPAIQEFCLFAVVGLATDFFLQMVFFTTVLSIDIRRMELSDLQRQAVYQSGQEEAETQPIHCPVVSRSGHLPRSRSMPRLTLAAGEGPPPSPPPGGSPSDMVPGPTLLKLPKRLRFLYFWARTRMFQRIMMIAVVVWSLLLGYKSGVVEQLVEYGLSQDGNSTGEVSPFIGKILDFANMRPKRDKNGLDFSVGHGNSFDMGGRKGGDEYKRILGFLHHEERETWRHLSYMHWPTLFGYYDISLRGRYLSILPSTLLSIVVSPEEAIKIRHPSEKADTDTPDTDVPPDSSSSYFLPVSYPLGNKRFRRIMLPQTKMELVFTVLFLLATMSIFVYFMVMLYKIVCSRNYAKWRSSWAKVRRGKKQMQYVKQVRESVPLVLEGHSQEVECIAVDNTFVVSACLGGQLRIWDSNSGECLTVIHRRSAAPFMIRTPAPGRNIDDSDADLYAEYHETLPVSPMVDPKPPLSAPLPKKSKRRMVRHVRYKSADWANLVPDLSSTIDTQFSAIQREARTREHRANSDPNKAASTDSLPDPRSPVFCSDESRGYDFSNFDSYFEEHRLSLEEHQAYMERRAAQRESLESLEGSFEDISEMRQRSMSLGSSPNTVEFDATLNSSFQNDTAPPIWCLACSDNLVVAGCGNGRVEIWDGLTGALKCMYEGSKVGVTSACFVGNKVMLARLNGYIDFLELETFIRPPPCQPGKSPPTLLQRGHVHRLSIGGGMQEMKSWDDIIHCSLLASVRAHQQPIVRMLSEGGRLVTACQDHTLKVYRIEDQLCLYTLHGHRAAVTTLFLDKVAPLAAASGSQDGVVRLWDLLTGACVHTLKCHEEAVTEITCSPLHCISISADDKLCIWERPRGQLLHCITMHTGQCNSISLLTNNLLISGGQGYIYLWDLQKGEILRSVQLSENNDAPLIRQVAVLGTTVVVCNFSCELRVVHFPTVLDKAD